MTGRRPRRKFAKMTDDQIADLLELCSVPGVTVAQVRAWTTDERILVENWVGSTWYRANDNPVRVPPRPDFLPRRGA